MLCDLRHHRVCITRESMSVCHILLNLSFHDSYCSAGISHVGLLINDAVQPTLSSSQHGASQSTARLPESDIRESFRDLNSINPDIGFVSDGHSQRRQSRLLESDFQRLGITHVVHCANEQFVGLGVAQFCSHHVFAGPCFESLWNLYCNQTLMYCVDSKCSIGRLDT